jgi:hypothetical protein
MAEESNANARSDILALAGRIQDLEAQFVRSRLVVADTGDTNACTNCDTHCTNCRGDRFIDVLMPGEEVGLSGAELVSRVRATRGK